MSRRGGKKDISKLVPIKKNVIDKRSNTPIERTYYIDPHTKDKKNKSKKPEIDDVKNEKGKKADRLSSKIKSFDDFAKKGIDPEAAKQFFCNL